MGKDNGNLNRSDKIQINLCSIPHQYQQQLATATLDFMRVLLSTSNGREMIDKKKSELNL